MSLPEVRLVLARDQAAEAGRLAVAGGLAALAAASAAGSKKAAEGLTAELRDLHWLAGNVEPPDPAAFAAQLAGLFGQIGIPSGN